MGTDFERHPPERGTLPVVVAGGCCTTCCCCCCAYVVGGLAGAAVGSAIARREGGEGTKVAVAKYWSTVRWVILAVVVTACLGAAFPPLWVLSGALLLVGVPVAQAVASIVMFTNRDPEARSAALKVTLSWLVLTVLGAVLTATMFNKCSQSGSGLP